MKFLFLLLWALGPYAYAAQPYKVLFIGDSHSVETFGKTLDKLLRSQDYLEVITLASCGSRPLTWINSIDTNCGYFSKVNGYSKQIPYKTKHHTPDFALMANIIRPQLFIIALGANQLGMPIYKARRNVQKMLSIVKKTSGRCAWIGPPLGKNKLKHYQKFKNLIAMLEETTNKQCLYLDSTQHTRLFPHTPLLRYGGDGIHFDQMGRAGKLVAKTWAEKIFLQIKNTFF